VTLHRSDNEKRTICAQTLILGGSVAQVARRFSMNANLIFKWQKDPRFAPVEGDPDPAVSAQRVDIALSDGRGVLVEGPTSLASILGLVRGLISPSRARCLTISPCSRMACCGDQGRPIPVTF